MLPGYLRFHQQLLQMLGAKPKIHVRQLCKYFKQWDKPLIIAACYNLDAMRFADYRFDFLTLPRITPFDRAMIKMYRRCPPNIW